MLASIVISTYSIERANCLAMCIESLKRQKSLPLEILLVLDPDNKLLRFFERTIPKEVKIIVSTEFGLSYARNEGAKSSKGDIVAFIDDDAIADEKWLQTLLGNYNDPRVVGVGGLIKPLWQNGRPAWFPEELDWIIGCSYKGLPEIKSDVRNPIGCNMSFRRSIFDMIGYFKTEIGRIGNKLVAGEESDFSMRIFDRLPESRIIYDPEAIVFHKVPPGRTALKYIIRRSFYEGYSKALVSKRSSHPKKKLTTESSYLKYLCRQAILSRLKRFVYFSNLCAVAVILISIIAVFAGYLIGKLV